MFALAAVGAVFYLFLLSKGDFTVVFPILGALGFLALPFIGKFILHESITPARVIGTVVIAVGYCSCLSSEASLSALRTTWPSRTEITLVCPNRSEGFR